MLPPGSESFPLLVQLNPFILTLISFLLSLNTFSPASCCHQIIQLIFCVVKLGQVPGDPLSEIGNLVVGLVWFDQK